MRVLRDLRRYLRGPGIVGVKLSALKDPQQTLSYVRELLAVVRLKSYASKLLRLREQVDSRARTAESVLIEVEQMVVDGLIPHDLLQPARGGGVGGGGLAWMVGSGTG
jgi:hypothetical protein